jgi:hypothetical protein
MKKPAFVTITIWLCGSWGSSQAFLSLRNHDRKMRIERHSLAAKTSLNALKPPSFSSILSSRKTMREKLDNLLVGENTFEKRQRIRENIEDLEDADFLMTEVKPTLLVHERDFFRQAMRMDAWDEYVLVSILCTSISFGALQSFQLNADHEGIFFYETVLKTAIQITAGLAVLCGLYSTMVFSLSILYGKTALVRSIPVFRSCTVCLPEEFVL